MNASDRAEIAAGIDHRLRVALDWEAAVRRPRPRVDMSAEAITARLADCIELSRLCLELAAPRSA